MKVSPERLAIAVCVAVVIVNLLAAQIPLGTAITPGTKASNPISHIVIIMQENHAFDNMFGAFPGLTPAYSVLGPDVVCNPISLSNPKNCISPWNADSESASVQASDMGHSWSSSHLAYDSGKMDAFVSSQAKRHSSIENYPMAYYTGATLPNYWDLASYFSLNANFFSSELSYSYPNHLYLVAASSGGCQQCNPSNDLTFPQIATEMTQYGVSWNYFAGNWKDSNDCKPISSGGVGYLNVLPDFPAVQLNSANCQNIKNLNDLYADINGGNLPDVSWVTPLMSNSDHPGHGVQLPTGQEYISGIIDGIESQPSLWSSTVIFVSWDDYGGYYDHVLPTTADAYGYGFRVPLIVISPYAVQGKIFYGPSNGVEEDFSAFLSTIEAQWTLSPLTQRDATDASLLYMLNFNQSPLPPLYLPANQLGVYPLSSCPTRLCNTTGTLQHFVLQPLNLSAAQDAID